jgi:hypothetical protein
MEPWLSAFLKPLLMSWAEERRPMAGVEEGVEGGVLSAIFFFEKRRFRTWGWSEGGLVRRREERGGEEGGEEGEVSFDVLGGEGGGRGIKYHQARDSIAAPASSDTPSKRWNPLVGHRSSEIIYHPEYAEFRDWRYPESSPEWSCPESFPEFFPGFRRPPTCCTRR